MIRIVKNIDGELVTLDAPIRNSWMHVVDPTPQEIARLQSDLDIPAEFIVYSLDVDERARTDRSAGVKLIVVHVPHHAGAESDIPYKTVALGIMVVKDFIVTISKVHPAIVDHVWHQPQPVSTAKRNRLILHLLLATAQQYLLYLRDIKATTEALEDRLQRSLRNRELLELLKYQKSLVYFTTGLKSNELMIQRLQRSQMFEIYPDDRDLLDDVLTETVQASEITLIDSNILNQMMDAFASIISNNQNSVMKFLAAVTVILALPTVVSGLFGMNVPVPFADAPWGFFAILAVASALSFGVGYLFWRQDWL